MSLRAMLWALHDAPVDDTTAVLVLLGLADHAGDDGTAAWPSRATLARYARCSMDTVDRRLRDLLAAGVITQGDQRLVERLRGDRRPVVYDLLMTGPQPAASQGDGAAEPAPRGRNTPPHGAAAVRHRTVLEPSRTSAGARPTGARAMTTPAWCRKCDTTHAPADPCQVTSRDRRPAPTDLRALVDAHRQETP